MNRIVAALVCFSVLIAAPKTPGQYEGMKYRIPYDANTIVLIDVRKLLRTAIANEEKWAAAMKSAYDAGVSALPLDATEVILAGRLDLEYGDSVWEIGLVKLFKDRDVSSVAARYGGTMDNIEGRAAARLPDDTYVVQLMSNLLASATPANRQDVTRWLLSTDVGSVSKLPKYLETAFAYGKDLGTPIIMGLDLDGVISEHDVREHANELDALKGVQVPELQLVKLIAGVRGVTLGISVEEESIGALRVDFSESPKRIASIGKALLIEVLQRQGAMIDDIRGWQPSIRGNSFLLKGKFSSSGMRRVMSVLELPPSLTEAYLDASSPGADQEGQTKLLASQSYFKAVEGLLDDLRDPRREFKTFGQFAIWYDKFARKIDRMSILNVDEQLVDYGARMASALRSGEMTMKSVGMRTSVRTASNQPSSGGYGMAVGGYRAGMGYHGGLYGVPSTYVGVNAMNASLQAKGQSDAIIRGQERTRGAASVHQLWNYIDEETAAIRRAMTQKYSADF